MATLKGGDKLEAALKEISQKVAKAATLRVGFLEGATYTDGTLVAAVAAFNEFGTAKSPPRPFFREMIAGKSGEWPKAIGDLLVQTGYDGEKTLSLTGDGIKGQLQQSIADFNGVPLKQSTIDRKGSDKQLVDTGHMLASVDYEVETK